jgi:hypothetical protein
MKDSRNSFSVRSSHASFLNQRLFASWLKDSSSKDEGRSACVCVRKRSTHFGETLRQIQPYKSNRASSVHPFILEHSP